VLVVSFPETGSVREETLVGETKVRREASSTLVLGGEWCTLGFRVAQLLDENIEAGFRMKLLILSLLDCRWRS